MSSTPAFEPPADPDDARPVAGTAAPDNSGRAGSGLLPGVASTLRLVDGFEAGRRARAAADAAEIGLLADAAASVRIPDDATPEQARRAELDRRSLIADLATATHVSEWTITRLLSEAADLTTRFAPGVAALARGEISRQHLSVIHDTGHTLTDEAARAQFLQIALRHARDLTPGRLTPVLRAIAERFLDLPLDQRAAHAATTRQVEMIDLPDNLAALTITHEATLIHGIYDRLTTQARSVIDARQPAPGVPDDTRTMNQLRADIATDTLLTAGPDDCVAGTGLDAIRGTVQITIPVLTMTGTTNEPVLLAGYGPIDTGTARALAAGTTGWERVMTSPVTGTVLAVDRYRPCTALDRFLTARDERCRFPGCRMPVSKCDVDHTIDHAHGGPTSHTNLAHLCRRHHVLKHHSAWTVEQTTPGVLVWTSPTGRRHTDRPEPAVRFIPDPETLRHRRTMHEPWLIDPFDDPEHPPPF